MKATLSIVLAGLLVILPTEQVLAQQVQRETASAQHDGAHLLRAPQLTPNRAWLWGSPSALLTTESVPIPAFKDWDDSLVMAAGIGIGAVVSSADGARQVGDGARQSRRNQNLSEKFLYTQLTSLRWDPFSKG